VVTRKSRSGTSRSNAERRAAGGAIVKSFTLTQDVAALLAAEAKRLDLSQAEIVNDALRQYLPKLARRSCPEKAEP
jgi:hypothetical protein